MTNQEILDAFLTAYNQRNLERVEEVMSVDVVWTFMGQHPLAGEKKGVREVIAFFDSMNSIMGQSKPKVEKLIACEDGKYLIECQHVVTHRTDGNNLDHHVCVLWTFDDGQIVSGMHFFAHPQAADRFFSAVTELKPMS